MIHECMDVNVDYAGIGLAHDDTKATLTTYIMDTYPGKALAIPKPLILICPGGGFGHLSVREGEPVALRMNSLGFHAAILRYTLAPNEYPCALYELATAMKMIHEHAKEWYVDENRIIVAGFSAGGYLAASLGTFWNDPKLSKNLGVSSEILQPSGLLLGYPVITSGEYAHRASFENLLGSQYESLVEWASLENHVTKDTPKTFLWTTFGDQTVPMENAMCFAKALRKVNVPFEFHSFPYGSHGLSLANSETDMKTLDKHQEECTVWPDLFSTWLRHMKDE